MSEDDLIFRSSNEYPKPKRNPGRVDFDPREYDKLIEDQGVRVKVTPTVLCPNRTSLEGNNHVLDCPVCLGQGHVDLCSGYKECWAFIQSIKMDKKFVIEGIFDLRDAQITFPSTVRVSYMYKVELVDHATLFNQIVKKTAADTDILRYPPAAGLNYESAEYLLVDSEGETYAKGTDFRIVDQTIKWLTANRPGTGSLFSFLYPAIPTFRVLELLHDTRFYYSALRSPVKKATDMPQQAIIRLDFITKDSGSNVLKVTE